MCGTNKCCGGHNPSEQIIFEWGIDCLSWDVDESHQIQVPLPYGYRLVSVLPYPYGNPNNVWYGDDAEIQSFIVPTFSELTSSGSYTTVDPEQSYVYITVKRTDDVLSSCNVIMWLLLEKGCIPVAKEQYNSPDPS